MDSQPKFTRLLVVFFSLVLFRFEKVYSKRSLNFDIDAHIEWNFYFLLRLSNNQSLTLQFNF